jgi:iron complex outermembrane receptor protein
VISREDIEKSGFQSVGDMLQNLTSTGAPPISRAAPAVVRRSGWRHRSSACATWARSAPSSCCNGRRPWHLDQRPAPDVSTIPAAAVERIEVLKDGASALLWLGRNRRRDQHHHPHQLHWRQRQQSTVGQYSEGDGDITKADMVLGGANEKGSITLAAEWAKEEVVARGRSRLQRVPAASLAPDRRMDDGWRVWRLG